MKMKRFAGSLLAIAMAVLPLACSKTYDFDPIPVGDDTVTHEPRAKSNSQFVRAVYADLLGRSPEVYDFSVTYPGMQPQKFPVDEQAILLQAFDGIGDPTPLRDELVAGLLDSSEVKLPEKADVKDPRAFVLDEFHRLLGREPTTYELHAFLDAWSSDQSVGPKTVIRAIVGSREYQSQ